MGISHSIAMSVAAGGMLSVVVSAGNHLKDTVGLALGRSAAPAPLVSGTGADGVEHTSLSRGLESLLAALPDTAEQRRAARQYSLAVERAIALMQESRSESQIRAAVLAVNDARTCVDTVYPGGLGRQRVSEMQRAAADSEDRSWRWLRFTSLAQEHAVRSPAHQACNPG